ncbi:hypothetical protein BTJ68_12187 [Hortaea werneckii EXF-2000]|uniref:Uncharacterized protein n=1 Tax=Hortaea werneckii EXF-2000 TaxID=1157616 RepID=A0A1Z5SSM8_HORWE|nr:hypothetical protein BTJ68_12187 [Hortaea werneckii EXF-2000]
MLKQETFGTCYSTFDSHILSGGYSQQIDLEEQFGFNLVGGPRPPLRRRSKQGARRSISGSSDCGGSLPIGNLSINVPARFRLETPGELFTYRAMEPTRSAIRKTNEPSTTQDRSTTTRHTTVTHYNTVYKTCDGARYPQLCFHYSSVIEGDRKYALNTCPNLDIKNNLRPLVALRNMQHTNSEWRDYIAQSYTAPSGIRRPLRQLGRDGCEKDEWPPQQFQQGVSDGYIRYLPGHQNGGVANHGESGWSRFCKHPPEKSVAPPQGGAIANGVVVVVVTTHLTLNVHSMTWKSVSPPIGDPEGLTANVCRPSVLTADVGYALLTDDPWYNGVRISDYRSSPGRKTQGVKKPVFRRDEELMEVLDFVDGKMVVDEGNSSRPAYQEEIEELGYERCETPDCQAELDILHEQQANASRAKAMPPSVAATASTTDDSPQQATASRQPETIRAYPAAAPTLRISEGHPRRHFHHHHHHRHHWN